jgi:hypothetical protein
MLKKASIFYFVISLLLIGFTFSLSYAAELKEDPVTKKYKEIITQRYEQEKDICKIVKDTIKEELEVKAIVRTCILLGHDPCLVVRCAIEANGGLEDIILGALQAGASEEVCSRCAIDSGADPLAVAEIIERGFETEAPDPVAPLYTPFPGADPGGGYLSPSLPSTP